MATVNVTINAIDAMSPTITALHAALAGLAAAASRITIGGGVRGAVGGMVSYTERLFENMLNSLGTKLWKTFTNNLKSAYQEIKAIDDELVVVRRVTGKTNEELAGMTRNAMKVAQTYGVAASKYLSGVADFTRAGYKDQAEGLAELSVKLQRAGDVSADVANQYILAIDKAYGLNGNIQALTAAMDGANQIGNEYATNVAEISAGIGKLATIAATAHVGIDELTAALGTVTAVTQRSGSEAATALRAIFLNIMGDTTTEIEDGAKWTAGEIEGLRDVLEMYAPEVVRAAEATGTLIDPMEAIGALAKSYKEGILTEAKLFSMVSDIGGKLRTNQLMVLIKSWDMYESMLKTFANASGSIDREVENSLDSITVKTERLKASWVALVNDTVSTGMIKDVLDGLNTVVQSVGNLANALTIVLGLVTALKAQRLATLTAGLFGMSPASITGMTTAFRGFGVAVTAIGVALSVANGIIKNHNESLDKSAQAAVQSANKASQTGQEIMKLYSNFVTAKAGTEQYTTALKALAEALGITSEEAEKAGDGIKNLTLQKMQQAAADARAAMLVYNTKKGEKWFPKTVTADFGEYVGELRGIVEEYKDFFEWTSGDKAVFSSDASIESFVTQYQAAEKMMQDLNLYASQNGIDISKFQPYMAVHDFLQETKAQYEEARSLLMSYADLLAYDKYMSMPGYEGMLKMQSQIAQGGKVSIETLREFAAEWDNLISSISDSDFDGHGKWVRESLVGILDKEYPQIAKYSRMWHEMMNSGGNGMADSADNAADSVERLTQALSTATKAKKAFDAAMEEEAENKGFTDYQSAYAAYAEEIEAGRVGSRRAMAAAEYLMAGSDKYNFDALFRVGGYKAVNAAMKMGPWATVYGDAEKTYGEGFLTLLGKIDDKNGEIVDSNGKVVASYKNVNGQVHFVVDDMWGLADATDMSVDQVWKAIQALSVYGKVDTGVEEFTQQLKDLGETAGVTALEGGKLAIDYEKFLSYATKSGMLDSEWEAMKQWLYLMNEIGMVEVRNAPDVEGGWQNYDDHIAEMRQASEQSVEDAQMVRDYIKEAKELAAESTPEALGLPQDVSGYENVTEQVATMNDFLNGMRLSGNEAGADEMLAKLNAAAQMAGGSLEIVDGQIKAIKDAAGNNADWDFLSKLINTTGLASAAPTENGMVIAGAGEYNYTISFTVDPDGSAQLKIMQLLKDSDQVAQTRTLNYNANGDIENIDTVVTEADNAGSERVIGYYTDGVLQNAAKIIQAANGVSDEMRLVTYGTDGHIENIETVKTLADGTAQKRNIKFDAQGEVESFDVVDGLATSTAQERHVAYSADPDTLKEQIPGIMDIASSVTTNVREITYGANGDLLDAQITTIDNTADKPTQTTRYIRYDADDDKLVSKTGPVITTADEAAKAASNKALIAFTGNIDDVTKKSGEALLNVQNTANSAESSIFKLTGENDSVLDAADEALEAIYDSAAEVSDGGFADYQLQSTYNGVLTALDNAEKAIGESIEDTNTTYTLHAEADGNFLEVLHTALNTIVEFGGTKNVKFGEPLVEVPGLAWNKTGQWETDSDGKHVITAKFEAEDGSLLDVLAELNEAGEVTHRIKLVTYGDGQQLLEELIRDKDGNETKYTVSFDAGGDASTSLDDMEETVENLYRAKGYMSQFLQDDAEKRLGILNRNIYGIKPSDLEVDASLLAYASGGNNKPEVPFADLYGDLVFDTKVAGGIRENPVKVPLTVDKTSAIEAGEEAQEIVSLALGKNPVPFIPADDEDAEGIFAGQTLSGEDVYRLSFEVDNEGLFDQVWYLSQDDGVHVFTIQTAGDGAQTITEMVYDLDGVVQKTNVITVDSDGNAETNLENMSDLVETIDRVLNVSVFANTSESQSRLNKLKSTLDGIKSKTVTVTAKTQSISSDKDTKDFDKNANGTDHFGGGYSLINEEGPELVATDGMAYIYANGFPTVAKIPGGAKIYTAEQTAAMLGGKMGFPAYADGKSGTGISDGGLGSFISGLIGTLGDAVAPKKSPPDFAPKGDVQIPKTPKKDEEDKKTEREEWEERQQGSQQSQSEEGEEASFWDTIRAYIDYGLKKIQYQIDSYQDDITAIERARDELLKPIEEELEDLDYSLSMLHYEVTLLERARDDAIKPLDKEIERLEKARDINKEDLDLEEKRQALEDARQQRTIRYFNEATGQWEWMADAKAIKEAQEAYDDALAEYEITMLKRQKEAIEDQYKEQIEALEDQEEVLERKQEDLEHEKTKIEYEYGESIDPLQDALDKLQQTYDDLDKYYQRLVDAVEVPLESLTDALQKMMSAGENYVAQMEGTVKLLDALYALAPTWSAIAVGDIGKYSPEQGKYGSYSSVDQSTTIIVDGITIDGTDATTMSRILGKYRIYKGK